MEYKWNNSYEDPMGVEKFGLNPCFNGIQMERVSSAFAVDPTVVS